MTSSVEAFEIANDPVARTIIELPGDRSVAAAQQGTGPECLVIHGTLMTLEDMWLGLVPALAEYFSVTSVDRPGHGFSRRPRLVDASPWRQATLIHDFALATGIRRPVLVGHSYGGTVALAYAMLFPDDVAGIVAIAPVCLPELRLESILFGPRGLPVFGESLTAALGITVDPLLLQVMWRAIFLPQVAPARFLEEFALAARFGQMVAEGEDAAVLMPTLMTMAPRYAACQVPTRFFGGSADIVVNNALHGQAAAAAMPNADFTWVAGIGHMLHHFAQDRIVAAARSLVDRDVHG